MNQDKFKKNFEDLFKVAKTGISQENKALLLAELDEMKATLEKWKAENAKDQYANTSISPLLIPIKSSFCCLAVVITCASLTSPLTGPTKELAV